MKPALEALYACVEANKEQLFALSDFIHDHPELGNQEFEAVHSLTSLLIAQGFTVQTGVAGLPTAFSARYQHRQGGPVVGLLCEYDALEGIGHGCAHNLQGPAMIGAATALKHALGDTPATIMVFGTPAEETTSGKLPMAQAGLFDELSIALMMHGGDRTTVDRKTLAMTAVTFAFEGRAAHAAVAPDKGISALDGVLMTFNGLEYLREHVRSDVRIHGVITEGGVAPNIVPAHAVAKFAVRAADRAYLDEVKERVYNVARGAALATGTKLTIQEGKTLDNKINVDSLNEVLLRNAELAGATHVTPPREQTGSTDFSIVTSRIPGTCLRVGFVPLGTSNHTKEWVLAAKSETAYAAIVVAAKAIAATALEVIEDPSLLLHMQEEFAVAKQALSQQT